MFSRFPTFEILGEPKSLKKLLATLGKLSKDGVAEDEKSYYVELDWEELGCTSRYTTLKSNPQHILYSVQIKKQVENKSAFFAEAAKDEYLIMDNVIKECSLPVCIINNWSI